MIFHVYVMNKVTIDWNKNLYISVNLTCFLRKISYDKVFCKFNQGFKENPAYEYNNYNSL